MRAIVSFSSRQSFILHPASAPVASHHPPFAPWSPQQGCFYGNNRICSGPVHAVSVSPLSLLSPCSTPFSRCLTASSWLLPVFIRRSLFVCFFAPYCSCLDARWRKMDGFAQGDRLRLLCWVSLLRLLLPIYCILSIMAFSSCLLSFTFPSFFHTNRVHGARLP